MFILVTAINGDKVRLSADHLVGYRPVRYGRPSGSPKSYIYSISGKDFEVTETPDELDVMIKSAGYVFAETLSDEEKEQIEWEAAHRKNTPNPLLEI